MQADVAELADAPDLGSGSERSEGSSPFIRISGNRRVRTRRAPYQRARRLARRICWKGFRVVT